MESLIKKYKKRMVAALLVLLSGGTITIGVNADGLFIEYEQVKDESGNVLTDINGDTLEFRK